MKITLVEFSILLFFYAYAEADETGIDRMFN